MKKWNRKLAPIDQTFNGGLELNEGNQIEHIQQNNQKVQNLDLYENRLDTEVLHQPLNTPPTLKLSLIFVPLIIVGLILLTLLPVYLGEQFTTIVIIGTNDLHGKVYPTRLFRSDTHQDYNYGGLTYMLSLMKIVSDQYKNNTLYLDAGDQYQGGIQASKYISNGSIMNDFFKKANLQASAIGNHDFDDGLLFLQKYLKDRTSYNIAANIISEKGEKNFLPNQVGEKIYTLISGIRIGVIGLATIQTPSTTAAYNKTIPAYQFLDYKDIVIEKSNILKSQGADVIIIVSHVGNACTNNFTNSKRDSNTNSTPCQQDQISKLIKALPPGTVNAVVQGHRHRTAHHYINSVPVMGVPNGGYYLNFMYLKFNRKKELVSSYIQGPVPVCEKIFENLKTCQYLQKSQLATAGRLVPWQFHGVQVKADAQFDSLINQKYNEKMVPYFRPLIKTQITLLINKTGQSDLGNLFCDLLVNSAIATNRSATFAILNPGGFRTQWYPGIITYQHYFNMFPFTNQIQTFQIDGNSLINTLNKLYSNSSNDIFSVSKNLKINMKKYSNGTRQFINASFFNYPIQPSSTYIGVTINFLLNGGDAFKTVINSTYYPFGVQTIGEFRAIIEPHLTSVESPIKGGKYMDLNERRINIQIL